MDRQTSISLHCSFEFPMFKNKLNCTVGAYLANWNHSLKYKIFKWYIVNSQWSVSYSKQRDEMIRIKQNVMLTYTHAWLVKVESSFFKLTCKKFIKLLKDKKQKSKYVCEAFWVSVSKREKYLSHFFYFAGREKKWCEKCSTHKNKALP